MMGFFFISNPDHSAENVFFWLEVEKFRQLTEKAALISQARHIYSGYVCDGAVHEINIDGDDKQFMKHAIEMAGDQIDNQLFDNAQKHIFLMMKEGSYPRFLRSAECRQLLESPPEPQPGKKGC